MPQIDYYKNLVKIMYKTRGCRFSAASALKYKEKFSIITVSSCSIYLIAWSFISMSYPEIFTPDHARFYGAISSIASISLLSISLLDFAFGRSLQAEKLHQNALIISGLMRRLERELENENPRMDEMEKLAVSYEAHIAETYVNHTPMDYRRWIYMTAKSDGWFYSPIFFIRNVAYNIYFYATSMFFYLATIAIIVVPTILYTFILLKK